MANENEVECTCCFISSRLDPQGQWVETALLRSMYYYVWMRITYVHAKVSYNGTIFWNGVIKISISEGTLSFETIFLDNFTSLNIQISDINEWIVCELTFAVLILTAFKLIAFWIQFRLVPKSKWRSERISIRSQTKNWSKIWKLLINLSKFHKIFDFAWCTIIFKFKF